MDYKTLIFGVLQRSFRDQRAYGGLQGCGFGPVTHAVGYLRDGHLPVLREQSDDLVNDLLTGPLVTVIGSGGSDPRPSGQGYERFMDRSSTSMK